MSSASSSAVAKTGKVAPPVKKLRPARKQVRPDEIDKSDSVQTGKEYNIWYNKWAGGDREDSYHNKTHAQSRCVIMRDSGYTRADAQGTKYCCLFFARGCCPYGHECQYLHRLPLPSHILPDNSLDCFARERHADYRDDMGGVGSFTRQNRTLYVGKMREGATKADTEEIVRRHFGEWGEIARLNILHNRGVAFVTYVSDLNAGFAKEAMANQSMDGDEILNVRWATEDPNPVQKVAEHRRIERLGAQGVATKINPDLIEAVQSVQTLEKEEEEDYYPIEASAPEESNGDERPSKRARTDDGETKSNGGLLGHEAIDNLKYFADLAREQAESARKRKEDTKPVVKPNAMGLLGGYGSDSE